MTIKIYNDFVSFDSATEQLFKIDFLNLPLEGTNNYYYHDVRPLMIPNPLVLEGVKFTSPCFILSTYDETIDNDVIYLDTNSKINFPENTMGVMLKIENNQNCVLKVTDFSGEISIIECHEIDPYVYIGFTSPKGILSIEFLQENTFLCDIFFTPPVN